MNNPLIASVLTASLLTPPLALSAANRHSPTAADDDTATAFYHYLNEHRAQRATLQSSKDTSNNKGRAAKLTDDRDTVIAIHPVRAQIAPFDSVVDLRCDESLAALDRTVHSLAPKTVPNAPTQQTRTGTELAAPAAIPTIPKYGPTADQRQLFIRKF